MIRFLTCCLTISLVYAGTTRAEDWRIESAAGGVPTLSAKHLPLFTNSPKLVRGVYLWRYDSRGETVSGGERVIARAMKEWSAVCGVRFVYLGRADSGWQMDNVSTISWIAQGDAVGGFALSWLNRSGDISESDIAINSRTIQSEYQLAMLVRHEIGHAIGLAHSDVEQSVMSGPPYTQYAFPFWLTPDDVQGCISLYGGK